MGGSELHGGEQSQGGEGQHLGTGGRQIIIISGDVSFGRITRVNKLRRLDAVACQ
jgi:hypothetical protein